MIETLPVRLIAQLLLPATSVIALALLVKGYAETGDGFSAALIAGAGVLVQYLALDRERVRKLFLVRHSGLLCALGLLLLLGTAFAPLLVGEPPVTHFPRPGTEPPALGTLELHTGFLIELGIFLVVLGFLIGVMDVLARTGADDPASKGEP